MRPNQYRYTYVYIAEIRQNKRKELTLLHNVVCLSYSTKSNLIFLAVYPRR